MLTTLNLIFLPTIQPSINHGQSGSGHKIFSRYGYRPGWLPDNLTARKDGTPMGLTTLKLVKMAIAASFSLFFIISAIVIICIGFLLLGWALSRLIQNTTDPEDYEEITEWEEYTAGDGNKYLWPKEQPRSSRNTKNYKKA